MNSIYGFWNIIVHQYQTQSWMTIEDPIPFLSDVRRCSVFHLIYCLNHSIRCGSQGVGSCPSTHWAGCQSITEPQKVLQYICTFAKGVCSFVYLFKIFALFFQWAAHFRRTHMCGNKHAIIRLNQVSGQRLWALCINLLDYEWLTQDL